MHFGKTLASTTVGMKLYYRRTIDSVDVGGPTLEKYFQISKQRRVLAGSLNIIVNSMY
jgi:hypothetical protein